MGQCTSTAHPSEKGVVLAFLHPNPLLCLASYPVCPKDGCSRSQPYTLTGDPHRSHPVSSRLLGQITGWAIGEKKSVQLRVCQSLGRWAPLCCPCPCYISSGARIASGPERGRGVSTEPNKRARDVGGPVPPPDC